MSLQFQQQQNIFQVSDASGGGGLSGLSQTPQTFPHFLAPEKIHRRLEEMGGCWMGAKYNINNILLQPHHSTTKTRRRN